MNQENLKKITVLRHVLHQNAELSCREVRTKRILMDFLAENTKLHIVDMGKWFYAEYLSAAAETSGVMLRADFDALPMDEALELPYASVTAGVSHKCGHDGHSACLAGLALELDARGADRNVYLVFQHGEEIGAGGEACAELIDRKHISRVYALHNRSGFPEGAVVVRDGLTQCASEGIELLFRGKMAHASQPETGNNPAGAIAALISYAGKVAANRCFEEMVLCTVTHVQIGARSFGIAAGEGSVCLVVRANRESDMERLAEMLQKKAAELCEEDDLKLECRIHDYFPETRNHPEAVAAVKNAAAGLGLQILEPDAPWRASEDFGYYTKKCPGAMFYIGNGEAYPHVHTEAYDYNDHILETGADMFWQLIRSADPAEDCQAILACPASFK